MKKILLILLAIASPAFAQLQTNKMNNTALILATNSSFTYLKGPIVAGYVLSTDANGQATWQSVSSVGGGNVFTTSNNTFSSSATNTFNGGMTTSNIVINGFINQTQANGGSNMFAATTNSFSGVLLASTIGGTHRIGGITIANANIGSAGSIVIQASSFTVGPSATPHLFQGAGVTVTNNLVVSNMFTANNNGVIHTIGSLSVSALNIYGSGNGINVGGAGSGLVTLHPTSGNNVLVRGSGMTITNSLIVSNSLLVANGTTQIGTNGTAMTFIKSATASLDFPSIAPLNSSDLTITVGGAVANDVVAIGAPSDENAALMTRGFVSANDTVTVRAYNVSSNAVDQTSKTYRVQVTHF